MEELEIDIMGMVETNRPWTKEQKAFYDNHMNKSFKGSRTLYTAAPTTTHTTKYQPGGNLLTITSRTTGCITNHGTDAWG